METVRDMRSFGSNPVSCSETSIKIYGSKEEIRARKSPETVDAPGFAPDASIPVTLYGAARQIRTADLILTKYLRHSKTYQIRPKLPTQNPCAAMVSPVFLAVACRVLLPSPGVGFLVAVSVLVSVFHGALISPCVSPDYVIFYFWRCQTAAVSPLDGGQLLCPPIFGKEGCPMVTYSELIQIGILIVGIIGLVTNNKKK